mgnify:CR=1 FL=1
MIFYNKQLKGNFLSLFTEKSSAPQSAAELQSQTIMWLRFPLVLLVLLIHVNPQNKEIFTPIPTIDVSHLTIANIYSIIARLGFYFSQVTVPFFFFTSGYFFFYKVREWNKQCYKIKIKKRLKTLLVPYLLWNLLALCLIISNKCMGIWLLHKPEDGFVDYLTNIKPGGVLWDFSTWNENTVNLLGLSTQMYGPFLLPLWFLRDLIVISFVLTPIIYNGIKYLRVYWVVLLGIAYLLNICTLPGINITGIFFFSWGAYLSISQKNMVTAFLKKKNTYLVITIFSLFSCVVFDSTKIASVTQQVYCIATVASLIHITGMLLNKGVLTVRPKLSQTSFFVYALHPMVILKVSCLELAIALTERMFFASHYDAGYILSYLLSPLLGALLCLIVFAVLKTIMPRFLNLLTGGRD